MLYVLGWACQPFNRRIMYVRSSNTGKRTLWLLARDPLSLVVETSDVIVDSSVNGAVLVQFAVQRVRHRTARGRN